jgi:hypothetical protein
MQRPIRISISFTSQSHDWVYCHRAPRRDVAGEESNKREKNCHDQKSERIRGAYAKKQTLQKSGEGERSSQADAKAN